MKINILEKGQTLIEVLAALSIATVLVFGITAAVIFSLNNVSSTKNRNLANLYAEQGMEMVRQIWSSNLNYFNSLPEDSNYYCLDKNYILDNNNPTLPPKDMAIPGCSTGGNAPGNNVDVFAREVDIFKNEEAQNCASLPSGPPLSPAPIPEATKVVVTVSWSDSKCSPQNIYCHKVELVSCFSKTHPLSEP